MDVPKEHIESLAKNVEQFEQKARRRAWLSTLVPLLFGGVLLGYTIWQIQFYGQKLTTVQKLLNDTSQELGTTITDLENAQEQLSQADTDLGVVQEQLAQTQKDLEQTKAELEEANQALKDASTFVSHAYPIDIVGEKNSLTLDYPEQAAVLFYIQELQYSGVGWNPTGFSVEEGFNSPSFVVHVLQHFDLISPNYDADDKPWQILKPVTVPAVGDVVYYEGGYSMFYFEIDGSQFVIGMTPVGIISLKPDFAPNPKPLCVPYHGEFSCP